MAGKTIAAGITQQKQIQLGSYGKNKPVVCQQGKIVSF